MDWQDILIIINYRGCFSNRMNKSSTDFHYKIVLLGDSGVGKSNIFGRFTKNEFNMESKTTIGVEFATKNIEVKGKTVKTQIWDTAGQERYRSMASAYYRGASGALLIYDITRASSFDNLEKWVKELKNFASEDIVCLLIGNKSDLRQYRSLKTEHGQQYAKEHKMGFLETSALEGVNIDEAFHQMIEEILERNKNAPTNNSKTPGNIKREVLQIQKNDKDKKKCCKS